MSEAIMFPVVCFVYFVFTFVILVGIFTNIPELAGYLELWIATAYTFYKEIELWMS